MGIEHRMKDEKEDEFWKCPCCGSVEELDMDMPKGKVVECGECGDKVSPHDNKATWEDFWKFCRHLKDV